ncbi:hypothetical protein [Bacillus pacificus]|nr:hypothetical protein [Bacillus pacificus]MCU5561222.1 hypothetical protein [Bacillus pacificus]
MQVRSKLPNVDEDEKRTYAIHNSGQNREIWFLIEGDRRNFAHIPYMNWNDFMPINTFIIHNCNTLSINFRMSECNSGSKVLGSLI